MGAENRSQRIVSVVVIAIFVTLVSCSAYKSTKSIITDEEAETAAEIAGEDAAETDIFSNRKDDASEAEYTHTDSSEENKIIFGKGISSEKSLPEDVVSAFQNGDMESLVGVSLGEEYDYDVYTYIVQTGEEKGWYRPKECIFDEDLRYFFDGKGHRFSGFSISSGETVFLGISFGEEPASIFVKAFGEPDLCEETEDGESQDASWYFDRTVLTVTACKGYVEGVEYKALGDAADAREKSDFELRMEQKTADEKAEAVYSAWGDDGNENFFEISVEEYHEGKAEQVIEDYLEEQGFAGKNPERIVCDGDVWAHAECRCYADEKEGRFCFVVIYSTDSYCYIYRTVKKIDEAEEPEHLVCQYDEEGNVLRETGYDSWGKQITEAFYTCHEGIPFPFVTEIRNADFAGMLCPEQKTWFYEKNARFDDRGRVVETDEIDGDDWEENSYFRYACSFFYRPDGKIEKIEEEMPEKYADEASSDTGENYYGKMEFEYSKDGVLKKMYYERLATFWGTTDTEGYIDFDEQGRMVHNSYLRSHGRHGAFYFYHGDEKRPWAVVDYYPMYIYGFWYIYIYQPVEECS